MLKSDISLLISLINSATSRSRSEVVIKKTGSYTSLLQILSSTGIIKSYQEFPNLLIIKLQPSKPFSHLNTRKNQICKYSNINMQHHRAGGCSFSILNTDRGLVTSFVAHSQHIGGKIALIIV